MDMCVCVYLLFTDAMVMPIVITIAIVIARAIVIFRMHLQSKYTNKWVTSVTGVNAAGCPSSAVLLLFLLFCCALVKFKVNKIKYCKLHNSCTSAHPHLQTTKYHQVMLLLPLLHPQCSSTQAHSIYVLSLVVVVVV